MAEKGDWKKSMTGQAKTIAEGLVKYLEKEKLTGLLSEVAEILKQKAEGAKRIALVESAVELDDKEKTRTVNLIGKQFGQVENIEYRVQPDIIGGLKITVGDNVLDLSTKFRLEKIYEQI